MSVMKHDANACLSSEHWARFEDANKLQWKAYLGQLMVLMQNTEDNWRFARLSDPNMEDDWQLSGIKNYIILSHK
jgi:hypothetical protein